VKSLTRFFIIAIDHHLERKLHAIDLPEMTEIRTHELLISELPKQFQLDNFAKDCFKCTDSLRKRENIGNIVVLDVLKSTYRHVKYY